MAILDNPRHERFSQALAAGKSATEAYAEAGYAPNDGNCIRLKGNERITARVAEMQERGAKRTEITIAALTEMLLEDRIGARGVQQYGAAIAAVEKLGKLHGHFKDRAPGDSPDNPLHTEVRYPDPTAVAEIVARYSAPAAKLNGATKH